MAIQLNDNEKAFIKNNKTDLEKNNLKSFYTKLSKQPTHIPLGNISALFLEIGVDVWKYIDSVVDKMFEGADIEHISIPEGVTKIGAFAFRNCDKLTDVGLPSTLKKISKGAFVGTNLKQLYLPESVTSIEGNAFDMTDNNPIKISTPRRGISNKLFLPKNEIEWYKKHLVFIDNDDNEEE